MDNYNELSVGDKHPNWCGVEGIKFDFGNAGGVVNIFYKNPTDFEIQQIRSGNIKIGISYMDDVIFLTLKFGSLRWMDAPYTVHLSKPYTLQEVEPKSGYSLLVTFADAIDGRIKAIRYIGMPTSISKEFKYRVQQQKAKSFLVSSYGQAIRNIYNNYSTKDLVNFSTVRNVGM